MNIYKFKGILIGLFLSFALTSCSNDDEVSSIKPSTQLIEMEAEGGATAVSFSSANWYIAAVLNHNGDVNIQGETYSQDGELTKENSSLSLEGQGKIEALWNNKGFIITKNSPSSLKIWLKENSTGEEFGFTVIIKSGGEVKEIEVFQKKSQGYEFDSITYSLKEEDGDSIFVKKGTTVYNFNIPEPQEFSFSPYGGIDVHNQSTFHSNEEDAFVWLKKDSIMLEVPTDIHNNKIYRNGEKSLYSEYSTKKPHGFEAMETVTVPAGKSAFFTEQEWRKRQVSYKLRLINNRTREEKKVDRDNTYGRIYCTLEERIVLS